MIVGLPHIAISDTEIFYCDQKLMGITMSSDEFFEGEEKIRATKTEYKGKHFSATNTSQKDSMPFMKAPISNN